MATPGSIAEWRDGQQGQLESVGEAAQPVLASGLRALVPHRLPGPPQKGLSPDQVRAWDVITVCGQVAAWGGLWGQEGHQSVPRVNWASMWLLLLDLTLA